jgi:diaminopropionate ammonia-lyase
MRDALCLSADSRVVCLSTEGATDPAIYAEIVGRSADAVRGEAKP